MERRDFIKDCFFVVIVTPFGISSFANAEELKKFTEKLEVDRLVSAVCPYCASGCGILYGVRNDRIVSVCGNPDTWNEGRLCIKGATLPDLRLPGAPGTEDRILAPMIRDRKYKGSLDGFREISWNEALDFIAEKIEKHSRESAGDKKAFAFYGSGQVSNETQYAQSLFMKLGMNLHVDNNGRLCQATHVMSLVCTVGIDAPPMDFDDVYKTDNLFIFGCNMADSLPGWFGKVSDAKSKNPNLRLVIIDPVKIKATRILDYEKGDMYIPIKPAQDINLINSIAYCIIFELEEVNRDYKGNIFNWINDIRTKKTKCRYIDPDFIENYAEFFKGDTSILGTIGKKGPTAFKDLKMESGLEGFKLYSEHIKKFKPEDVCNDIGISENTIRKLAEIFIKETNTMSIFLQGFGHTTTGVAKGATLFTLHTITGRIARAGSGANPTVGQPNGLGQRFGGSIEGRLPGNRNQPVPEERREFAQRLSNAQPDIYRMIMENLELPDGFGKVGHTAVDMYKAIEKGEVKGVWIMCTNPMVSMPDLNMAKRALQNADLVVVQDIFKKNETIFFADVLLPAATTSGEATGTFLNTDRRVQLHQQAIMPPGKALSDSTILLAFAFRYSKMLKKNKRDEEAKLMDFLLDRILGERTEIFDDIDKNFDQIRELSSKYAELLWLDLAKISKGVLSNDVSGITYERLKNERDFKGYQGFKSPVISPTDKGTAILYDEAYEKKFGKRFATPNGKIRAWLWENIAELEKVTNEYPMVAGMPIVVEHWHTRVQTGRCLLNQIELNEPFVAICEKDAQKLQIKDGEIVRVESKRGYITLKTKIEKARPPREGFVYIPWCFGAAKDYFRSTFEIPPGTTTANILSADYYDPISKEPGFQYSAIRIVKMEE